VVYSVEFEYTGCVVSGVCWDSDDMLRLYQPSLRLTDEADGPLVPAVELRLRSHRASTGRLRPSCSSGGSSRPSTCSSCCD